MHSETTHISWGGKQIEVPTLKIDNREIIITGKQVKIARIKGEQWFEYDYLRDPNQVVKELRQSGLKADIFTFSQSISNAKPSYNYYMEWDNYAVVRIDSYDQWKKRIAKPTRRSIAKAQKKGVEVKIVDFNDELVRSIIEIYNETPFRQGRRFWHYRKDFDSAKKENSTYLYVSDFIGAYYENELIGFIKLVYGKQVASIMHILSKTRHQDKSPTNALLAKAVEICVNKDIPYLVFGNYIYGKKTKSTLTDFKRHNGFERIDVPRYYIPLTVLGKITLKLNLHHRIAELLPKNIQAILLKIRQKMYSRLYKIKN